MVGKGREEICWKIIVSCELEEIDSQNLNCVNIKEEFDNLSNLAESIIRFWSGNLWEQQEEMNKKLNLALMFPTGVYISVPSSIYHGVSYLLLLP